MKKQLNFVLTEGESVEYASYEINFTILKDHKIKTLKFLEVILTNTDDRIITSRLERIKDDIFTSKYRGTVILPKGFLSPRLLTTVKDFPLKGDYTCDFRKITKLNSLL